MPKLEYFGVHARGLPLRMALQYGGANYEDVKLDFPTFGANKAAGKYKFGQVPVLYLDDGKELYQSMAILRHIGRTYKGKTGMPMYPGNEDPELMYKIDEVLAWHSDYADNYMNFTLPLKPEYKEKDEHFVKFITGKFQELL